MNSLLILGLLVLLIATIFGAVYFIPILITKWRASAMGLKLSIGQSRTVTKSFCNRRDFILNVKEIWYWADIPIEKLTFHYLAKGDLTNLRDGIIEITQKNKEVDFQLLATIDLAGRNLKDEIKKAEMNNWTFSLVD